MVIKRKSRNSLNLKKPRTPVSAYRYAITARNTILIVIVASSLIVCLAVISAFLLNPERQVKQKFEALANNYYEYNFYENLLNSENFSGDLRLALQKYEEPGLSPVTLRQLLLYDPAGTADVGAYLKRYCDPNSTTVKFYPEFPYSRTSYHAEYTYDCNF